MTRCKECNGTGHVCAECGYPEVECTCEEFDSEECPECNGDGEIAVDTEDEDLTEEEDDGEEEEEDEDEE